MNTVYWLHKLFTAGILTVGALFNVIALFRGMDHVVNTYFTTAGEIVLTGWFFTAFVLGVLAEFLVPLEPRWRRVVRRVMTVYMFLLTLAHGVNNLLLQNQDGYGEVFSGPFYTYPALVMLTGLAIVVASFPRPRVVSQSSSDVRLKPAPVGSATAANLP
jgi:hypothetical protein